MNLRKDIIKYDLSIVLFQTFSKKINKIWCKTIVYIWIINLTFLTSKCSEIGFTSVLSIILDNFTVDSFTFSLISV